MLESVNVAVADVAHFECLTRARYPILWKEFENIVEEMRVLGNRRVYLQDPGIVY